MIRSCVPYLVEGGSIVSVTSIEGHRAGPGFAIYSAMKAAVENLTRTLALELADRRIRVNAVAPDMIPTPGDDALAEAAGALVDDNYDSQPWPETGTPDDAAGAVIFWPQTCPGSSPAPPFTSMVARTPPPGGSAGDPTGPGCCSRAATSTASPRLAPLAALHPPSHPRLATVAAPEPDSTQRASCGLWVESNSETESESTQTEIRLAPAPVLSLTRWAHGASLG